MTAMSIAGAAFGEAIDWHAIDWRQVHQTVRRLQARIVKAIQEGRWGKVRALQHLLATLWVSRTRSHGCSERLERLAGKLARAVLRGGDGGNAISLLDAKKCYELTSLICRGRQAKKKLLGPLLYRLWRGRVDEALALLESARPEAKDPERLDQLITYLSERRAYLPDYRARRAQRRYIGSAHTEKANDLIVARRQKHRGMHWERSCSDGLAALRTLLLNGGWDLYWQEHRVLPLAVPKEA